MKGFIMKISNTKYFSNYGISFWSRLFQERMREDSIDLLFHYLFVINNSTSWLRIKMRVCGYDVIMLERPVSREKFKMIRGCRSHAVSNEALINWFYSALPNMKVPPFKEQFPKSHTSCCYRKVHCTVHVYTGNYETFWFCNTQYDEYTKKMDS